MTLLIWGAEAVRGTIGAHPAYAGHQVTLVDRAADHMGAINRTGLTISGPVARFTARLVNRPNPCRRRRQMSGSKGTSIKL